MRSFNEWLEAAVCAVFNRGEWRPAEHSAQYKGCNRCFFRRAEVDKPAYDLYEINACFVQKIPAMRYHFNIRDDKGLIRDEEGDELATLEAARDEARASARDMMMDDLRCGRAVPERRIEIADDRGTVLDSIGLKVAFN